MAQTPLAAVGLLNGNGLGHSLPADLAARDIRTDDLADLLQAAGFGDVAVETAA